MTLERLKWLVFDEADNVFATDFGKNFAKQLFSKYLKGIDYKFIMTSATMTDDFRAVTESIKSDKNFGMFEISVEKLTLKNVYQFMIKYETEDQKNMVLKSLIEQLNV